MRDNHPRDEPMFEQLIRQRIATLFIPLLASTADAQKAPDLVDKIKAIGKVVNPPTTASL
jgi:hypothetical protein